MRFFVKLLISAGVIAIASQIGRKLPTLGGLIATMPLTGVIVLLWLYSDNPHNFELMQKYTSGALWGILPSILFFVVSYFLFKKHLSLVTVLLAGFGVWVIGAVIHQYLLG